MEITFKWVGGATWILDVAGLRIACDPVLCPAGTVQNHTWFKSRRLNDPVFSPDDFATVDLWLITHAHDDHLDEWGLRHIRPQARIICHESVLEKLRSVTTHRIQVLHWGERDTLHRKRLTVTVEALPAVHGVNPINARFAGGVNGYWVSIERFGNKATCYVTGDTVTHSKVMRSLVGRKADLLIPNMGAARKGLFIRTLTLSAGMLRRLIDLVRPSITIPVHFGTFEHYVEPVDRIVALEDESIKILQPGQSYSTMVR